MNKCNQKTMNKKTYKPFRLIKVGAPIKWTSIS